MEKVLKEESHLDVEELIARAMSSIEKYEL
jgi:hypothetical protein